MVIVRHHYPPIGGVLTHAHASALAPEGTRKRKGREGRKGSLGKWAGTVGGWFKRLPGGGYKPLTMGGGLKQQIAVICALCVYRMDARLCDIGRHAGQCGRGYCASALHRLLSGRSEVAIPLAEPTRPVGEAQE
jgi:hypothetical protein